MKIKYLGHASFHLTSQEGLEVIADPFGSEVPYPPFDVSCDLVTISHEHTDHNDLVMVKGSPSIIRGLKNTGEFQKVSLKIGDLSLTTLPSFHDEALGADRGENAIFLMDISGIKVAHLGDIGHIPSPYTLDALKDLDVLMLPVGGHYTIDGVTAANMVKKLKPKIAVPMHFLTSYVSSWPIKGPEDFLMDFLRHEVEGNEIAIEKDSLPKETKVWVPKI